MNEKATSLRKMTHCEPSAINCPLVNLHKLNCCKFSAQNCDKTCVLLAGKSCDVIICIIARIRKRQNSTISRFVFRFITNFPKQDQSEGINIFLQIFFSVIVARIHELTNCDFKLKKILIGSLDLILSSSPSVKI